MYIKGIEIDGLPHPLRKTKVNVDQSILDQNKKLKLDCYNNLAGTNIISFVTFIFLNLLICYC